MTSVMVKKKELCEALGSYIHKDAMGYKGTSKWFQVPETAVRSLINKYKVFHTGKNLKGISRKSKVMPRLCNRRSKVTHASQPKLFYRI